MTGRRITDPRGQILAAIRRSMKERGYPPTMREIADTVGFSAVSTVEHHLKVLQRQGAIQRVPNQARALVIADIYPDTDGAVSVAPETAPDPNEGIDHS